MSEPIRRFKFRVETWEDEDGFYLNDNFFLGTWDDANKEAERLGNEWENENDGLIASIEIESHGIVKELPNE